MLHTYTHTHTHKHTRIHHQKAFSDQDKPMTFYFQAPNAAVKKQWMDAIRQCASSSVTSPAKQRKTQNRKRQVVLVTSASTCLGVEVVRALLLRGCGRVRCIIGNIEQQQSREFHSLFASHVEIIHSSHLDESVIETAIDSVTQVCLIPPASDDLKDLAEMLVRLSIESGTVRHIVMVSSPQRSSTRVKHNQEQRYSADHIPHDVEEKDAGNYSSSLDGGVERDDHANIGDMDGEKVTSGHDNDISIFEHMQIGAEQILQSHRDKVGITILRMNQPMDNLATYFSLDISERNVFEPLCNDGRSVSYVSLHDVASCCVEVISSGGQSTASTAAASNAPMTAVANRFHGKTFLLTGPRAVSHEQISQMMTRLLNRRIYYNPKSIDDFLNELRMQGLPAWALEGLRLVHKRDNITTSEVTDDVKSILGRSAESIESYLRREGGSFGGMRKPFICIVTYDSQGNHDFLNTANELDLLLAQTLLSNGGRVLVIEHCKDKSAAMRTGSESKWGIFDQNPDFHIRRTVIKRRTDQKSFSAAWSKLLSDFQLDKIMFLTSCDIYDHVSMTTHLTSAQQPASGPASAASSSSGISDPNSNNNKRGNANVSKSSTNDHGYLWHVEMMILEQIQKAAAHQDIHVVKLSLSGSDSPDLCTITSIHHGIERMLISSELEHTIIRSNITFQTFGKCTQTLNGEVVNSLALLGNGKVSWVDVRDIAEALAIILTSDVSDFSGKVFNLTGPEELSLGDMTSIIEQHAGTSLSFEFHNTLSDSSSGTDTETERSLSSSTYRFESDLTELLRQANVGYLAMVSRDLESLLNLGQAILQQQQLHQEENEEIEEEALSELQDSSDFRTPRSFADWVIENVKLFVPSEQRHSKGSDGKTDKTFQAPKSIQDVLSITAQPRTRSGSVMTTATSPRQRGHRRSSSLDTPSGIMINPNIFETSRHLILEKRPKVEDDEWHEINSVVELPMTTPSSPSKGGNFSKMRKYITSATAISSGTSTTGQKKPRRDLFSMLKGLTSRAGPYFDEPM